MPTWLAGAASLPFTPTEPLWLAGYAARTAPSQGTLSDLHASALALQDPAGTTLLLAAVDIIAIPLSLADTVAEIVRAKHPHIPRHHFCFNASHTHYGPEIRPDKIPFFKIPPEYAAKVQPTADRLAQIIATTLLNALNDLTPVRLHPRKSSAPFAHNRRPQGDITDHDVPLLDIRNVHDNSIKSILFGYACHNTTMDPQDRLYSSDWAGHARALLHQRHPTCTPLFLTGCAADQNPHPRGTPALSQQYGSQLADAVTASLSSPAEELPPTLKIAATTTPLDMLPVTPQSLEADLASNDPPRQFKAQLLKDRLSKGETLETSYPAPLQVALLGHQLLMIFLSGETVIDYSHKFKRAFSSPLPHLPTSPPLQVWTSGYCNDMYGYVPTSRIQQEGGYEGGRANLWSWLPSPWTTTVEDRITTTIHQLVQQVTRSTGVPPVTKGPS